MLGTKTKLLWKSIKHSLMLSHLSSPRYSFFFKKKTTTTPFSVSSWLNLQGRSSGIYSCAFVGIWSHLGDTLEHDCKGFPESGHWWGKIHFPKHCHLPRTSQIQRSPGRKQNTWLHSLLLLQWVCLSLSTEDISPKPDSSFPVWNQCQQLPNSLWGPWRVSLSQFLQPSR